MKAAAKTYLLRMSAGFTVYVGAVCLAHFVHDPASPHAYWPLFLAPVLPIIYIVATIIRFIATGLDELQRKITLEAAAFSGIATGFSCVSYLFLENAGAPPFHADWGFYMMWAYYGIGVLFSSRRYR